MVVSKVKPVAGSSDTTLPERAPYGRCCSTMIPVPFSFLKPAHAALGASVA
jgi:hypothetical protein